MGVRQWLLVSVVSCLVACCLFTGCGGGGSAPPDPAIGTWSLYAISASHDDPKDYNFTQAGFGLTLQVHGNGTAWMSITDPVNGTRSGNGTWQQIGDEIQVTCLGETRSFWLDPVGMYFVCLVQGSAPLWLWLEK